MPINIDDLETENLARELASRTGESLELALKRALEQRLRYVCPALQNDVLLEELARIRKTWAALPVLDTKTPDDIISYDENGLPK
jgi:antitoxin VapB